MILKTGTRIRAEKGSGLVEGTCGVVILAIVFLASLCFIVGAGLSCYYKYKVGAVADRAAEYIAAQMVWCGMNNPAFSGHRLKPHAKQLVDKLLIDSGLPASSDVEVTEKNFILHLTVKVDNLQLLPGTNCLPMEISLQDTAVAVVPDSRPPAIMSLTCGGMAVYVPAYGLFVAGRSGNGGPVAKGVASFYPFKKPHFEASLNLPPGSYYSQTIH